MAGKRKLQTVLVSKSLPAVKKGGLKAAKQVAQHMHVKHTKVDETEHFYRFRQHAPGYFQEGSYRTFKPRTGVEFVFATLKTRKKRTK